MPRRLSSRRAAQIEWRTWGSRPVVGSSRMSREGLFSSARAHVQLGVQVVFLKDNSPAGVDLLAIPHRLQAEDRQFSRALRRGAEDHSHQRRLARAVGAEEADTFPFGNVKIHAVYRGQRPVVFCDTPAGNQRACTKLGHRVHVRYVGSTGLIRNRPAKASEFRDPSHHRLAWPSGSASVQYIPQSSTLLGSTTMLSTFRLSYSTKLS